MNRIAATALALLLCAGAAQARTLLVGPGQALKLPSQAAAIARDGDRVVIAPGRYEDCAVWHASRLVIEAGGPGVVLAHRTCAGKGIFVIDGRDVTVEGITFMDAHVPDHNGAGIRAEGGSLTVSNSQFIGNENGILAGGPSGTVLRVTGSSFTRNGSCQGACAHGVYAGTPIRLLQIDHCRFFDTRIGHHVKSRARKTVITNTRIEDGPDGTASYLIDVPNGGDVLVQGNVLQKGPRSDNPRVAISIGEEGVTNPGADLLVRDNDFASLLPMPTVFVRNATRHPARLEGNRITGEVIPLAGPGSVAP